MYFILNNRNAEETLLEIKNRMSIYIYSSSNIFIPATKDMKFVENMLKGSTKLNNTTWIRNCRTHMQQNCETGNIHLDEL